ncbi:MAG: hypothetical protein NY202_00410 [Mollicutes bacterium UO1]
MPNFQAALNNFYDERLKNALESKSSEYKTLFQTHLTYWQQTQKVLIAIALGIFFLLLIAYF